jgi:CRISPR system Cascade subunit CasB
MNVKHPLVGRLERLCEPPVDRAALASLRRALLPGGEAHAYPYVAPFFPPAPNPSRERNLVALASLFALHPGTGGQPLPLGLRQLREKSQSVDRRFVALLDADAEDAPEHLRHAVTLLRGAEISIDWHDLLTALLNWGAESRCVQRRWARMYWADNRDHEEEPS